MKIIFRVQNRTLLFIAGAVWILAGLNILRIGILTWMDSSIFFPFMIGEAIVVFMLFFYFVFLKLYYKHSERIKQKSDVNCPFSFFDARGWIMMIFMITLGVLIRRFHLLPSTFISVFYTGLSVALIITGILFLMRWKSERV